MNHWFFIAAALSAAICLIHVFAGGPATVPQLTARDGRPGGVGRMTAYYAWHIVTITLAAQALAFFMAAQSVDARLLAVFASWGAFAFAAWCLMMIAIYKLKPLLFPQWLLFLPVAVFGFAGLYI